MKRILPADRVSEIKEYYFSRKLREVARLKSEGHDIISLGIGGPDRMPPAEVVDTLCTVARTYGTHSYQPSTGLPELRSAMSRFYKRHYGVEIDPDSEILPLIGSKEGVMHISLTFLNPGDKVLVPNPGYPTYTSASRLVGAEVIYYDLLPENGWYPDFEAIERLPFDGVKLMWVNYPHMPTGTPAKLQVFERLVAFAKRHGIVIVNDNPYSFILNDHPLSLLQVEGARDVCIEINSMSKSHNMAGWRMGMSISNSEFIQWILKVKSNVDSGQFRPVMEAAAKGLDIDADWYADLNSHYRRRRDIAERIMKSLGCTFDSGQRGMFLWGRIPKGERSGKPWLIACSTRKEFFSLPVLYSGQTERCTYVSLSAPLRKDLLRRCTELPMDYKFRQRHC